MTKLKANNQVKSGQKSDFKNPEIVPAFIDVNTKSLNRELCKP